MKTSKNIFMIALILFCLFFPRQGYTVTIAGNTTGEYIWILDIMVAENHKGDINIVKIGRHGPFRRYSWFRVGDVIEAVDGKKANVFELQGINRRQVPIIRFRRGTQTAERQISLERIFYGRPSYRRGN